MEKTPCLDFPENGGLDVTLFCSSSSLNKYSFKMTHTTLIFKKLEMNSNR